MYDVLQKLLNEKYGESYKAVYLRFKRFIFAYRVISPQIYFKLKKRTSDTFSHVFWVVVVLCFSIVGHFLCFESLVNHFYNQIKTLIYNGLSCLSNHN